MWFIRVQDGRNSGIQMRAGCQTACERFPSAVPVIRFWINNKSSSGDRWKSQFQISLARVRVDLDNCHRKLGNTGLGRKRELCRDRKRSLAFLDGTHEEHKKGRKRLSDKVDPSGPTTLWLVPLPELFPLSVSLKEEGKGLGGVRQSGGI